MKKLGFIVGENVGCSRPGAPRWTSHISSSLLYFEFRVIIQPRKMNIEDDVTFRLKIQNTFLETFVPRLHSKMEVQRGENIFHIHPWYSSLILELISSFLLHCRIEETENSFDDLHKLWNPCIHPNWKRIKILVQQKMRFYFILDFQFLVLKASPWLKEYFFTVW